MQKQETKTTKEMKCAPRYSVSVLLWKANGKATYIESTGKIDMGWGTGCNYGIYENLFRDRGRIQNAKRKQTRKRFSKVSAH